MIQEKKLLSYFNSKIYAFTTSGGSTFPNISKSALNTFIMPKPSLKEQVEIVKILNSFNKKYILEELFKSMLQQLMTGQIRVHGLEFEKM